MVLRLSTFPTDVTGTLLTGLATGTNSAILATDTELQALAKLQAQISALSGGATPNPNWLINSDFSANQRGYTALSLAATGFIVDGWKVNIVGDTSAGGQATLVDADRTGTGLQNIRYGGNVKVTTANTTTGYTQMRQVMRDVYRTEGQYNNFSVWARSTTATTVGFYWYQFYGSSGAAAVQGAAQTQALAANTWTLCSWSWYMPSTNGVSVAGGDDYSGVYIPLSSGSTNSSALGVSTQASTWTFAAAKWETGQSRTPWLQDTAAKSIQDAQRRYYVANPYYFDGYNAASTVVHDTIIFPTTMDVVPTLTVTAGTNSLASAPTLTSATLDHAIIQTTKSAATGTFSCSNKLEFSNEI
jgi:hypothetical protein